MSDAEDQVPIDQREPVLVSACLLGMNCRYDGASNLDAPLVEALASQGCIAVPFCPEERGGLTTPRPAASIERENAAAVVEGNSRVLTREGADVTAEFLHGAEQARETCQDQGIRRAFLKERSPSCGVRQTHVGDQLVDGRGLTAEILLRAGVQVVGVEGRRRED